MANQLQDWKIEPSNIDPKTGRITFRFEGDPAFVLAAIEEGERRALRRQKGTRSRGHRPDEQSDGFKETV
jgi:hypothetical protein